MQEADRKLAWAGVVVLAIIALSLLWLLFVGPSDQHPNYAAQCERDCAIPWYWSSSFWLVFFTAILTISTYLLWRETRRLAQGGEAQHAAVNRAFVFVKETRTVQVINNGQVIGFQAILHWFNSGNTPTRHARTHCSWQSFPTPDLPAGFAYPNLGNMDQPQILIGPQSSIESDPLAIPFAVIQAAAAGQVHIFMWGWTDYNDVFEGTLRHRTEFCCRGEIKLEVNGQPNGIGFRFHGPYNGSDDDCTRPPEPLA